MKLENYIEAWKRLIFNHMKVDNNMSNFIQYFEYNMKFETAEIICKKLLQSSVADEIKKTLISDYNSFVELVGDIFKEDKVDLFDSMFENYYNEFDVVKKYDNCYSNKVATHYTRYIPSYWCSKIDCISFEDLRVWPPIFRYYNVDEYVKNQSVSFIGIDGNPITVELKTEYLNYLLLFIQYSKTYLLFATEGPHTFYKYVYTLADVVPSRYCRSYSVDSAIFYHCGHLYCEDDDDEEYRDEMIWFADLEFPPVHTIIADLEKEKGYQIACCHKRILSIYDDDWGTFVAPKSYDDVKLACSKCKDDFKEYIEAQAKNYCDDLIDLEYRTYKSMRYN